MLVDVHSHLDHCKLYERIDEVISNARVAGVKKILTAGVNKATNRKALELSKKYDIVEAVLGIYPVDALQSEMEAGEFPGKDNLFNIDKELEFIKENRDKITAIGECGLDYLRTKEKDTQKKIFLEQIQLAEDIKKPIIVHSRKAEQEVIDLLESSSIKKAVLHCFCGKKNLIKKASGLGYYFSIPTNIVHSRQFQDMVRAVNINQLFAETDAPYLSPFRGQWNEPANVIESYKKIAELKGFMLAEVEKAIFSNYQRIF